MGHWKKKLKLTDSEKCLQPGIQGCLGLAFSHTNPQHTYMFVKPYGQEPRR
jgi:hypothetical protein